MSAPKAKPAVSIRRIQRAARAAAIPPPPVGALDTMVYRAELGGITTLRDKRKLEWDRHVRLLPLADARDLCQLCGCHLAEAPEAVAQRYGLELAAVNAAVASGDLTSAEYRATPEADPVVVVVLDRPSRRALRAAAVAQEA